MTVDLEETLGRLLQIESSEIPILSVYLNIHPERFDKLFLQPRLNELLRPDEQAADSGRLEHKAKVSLREAVKRVLEMGPGLETSTDVSVAIFECPALGIDEVVGLPRQVWDTAMAGPTPYLRPLRAVIDELRTVAAVVLDTRHAEINVFRIGELLDRQVIEVEELRKSNLAGWFGLEEYRHRQHAEEVHHHLYREVSRRLERMQRDQGVDLVFIGGKQSSTDPLLPSLHPRVREISR
ncbi:MAG TPA: hypothetical protein VE569_10030, partial [Acidimicrobiia bacterium]|nr:hypothetical protein [Acidimicrobiia bacterium]